MNNLSIEALSIISKVMITITIVSFILLIISASGKNTKYSQMITYGLLAAIGLSITIGGMSKAYHQSKAVMDNTDVIKQKLNANIDINAQRKITNVDYIQSGDIENFEYIKSDPILMTNMTPKINISHILNITYEDGSNRSTMNVKLTKSRGGVSKVRKKTTLRQMGYLIDTGSVNEKIRFYSCSPNLSESTEPSKKFTLQIDGETLTGGLATSKTGSFATVMGEKGLTIDVRNKIIEKLDIISTKYNKDVSLLISNGVIGFALISIDPLNFELLNNQEVNTKLDADLDILSDSSQLITDIITIINDK